MIYRIINATDSRVALYGELRDRHLRRPSGLFVAESELVVRRLLHSSLAIHSVFTCEGRAESLAALRPDVDVFAASPEVMKHVVGFPFHRGVLALGTRPHTPELPSTCARILVIEDITDVDNLGSLLRSGAAFGIGGVLLSPRCADPYYRKALRTAVGCTFALPIVRAAHWPGALAELRERYGCRLIAAVLDAAAHTLTDYRPPKKFALCVGSEGPGLTAEARGVCDDAVTIPMAGGADSLNVGVAAAIILHRLVSDKPSTGNECP